METETPIEPALIADEITKVLIRAASTAAVREAEIRTVHEQFVATFNPLHGSYDRPSVGTWMDCTAQAFPEKVEGWRRNLSMESMFVWEALDAERAAKAAISSAIPADLRELARAVIDTDTAQATANEAARRARAAHEEARTAYNSARDALHRAIDAELIREQP